MGGTRPCQEIQNTVAAMVDRLLGKQHRQPVVRMRATLVIDNKIIALQHFKIIGREMVNHKQVPELGKQVAHEQDACVPKHVRPRVKKGNLDRMSVILS